MADMAIQERQSLVGVINPTRVPFGLATHQLYFHHGSASSELFLPRRRGFFRRIMFTKVCKESEIQDSELYRFEVGEKTLLVTRLGQTIVVTAAICTHEEADLTLGILQGRMLTCPLHQAKFDLETGSVLRGPDGSSSSSISPLKIYTTRIENGELLADL